MQHAPFIRMASCSYAKLVLLVEPDSANANTLQSILEQATPYFVFLVPNEAEALKLIPHVTPDLILVDDPYPENTDQDVYQHIISEPGLASVPIIVLTARLQRTQGQSTHFLFLPKPFELDTFLKTLRGQLNEEKGSLSCGEHSLAHVVQRNVLERNSVPLNNETEPL